MTSIANKTLLAFSLAIFAMSSTALGSVVTTLDFSNAGVWDVDIAFTGGGSGASGVVNAGSGLLADKTGGSGITTVTATLLTPLSTAGFTGLSLGFTETPAGGLEWNASDGLRVESSQGVLFDTTDANAAFETILDAGEAWGVANALTQSQDLTFDGTADNSAINHLVITLRVNANAEELLLENFQILGTATTAVVPEPTSLLVFGSLFAFAAIRRNVFRAAS